MRVIGMLGGMSWESTAVYYRLANELVRDRLGGLRSARVLLASVDFAEVEELQRAGDWEAAGALLAREARALEAGGAELLVLCTNTMHRVAGAIEAAVSLPLLHLVDVAAEAAIERGLEVVGLLGTAFTMEGELYPERFAARGLRVLVPPPADRAAVHRTIYEELCVGVVSEASRAVHRRIVADLVAAGAQGVVLGCTELELLLGPEDADVPLLPTTRLHVEAAVAAALEP